jgi:AcrR family transcriptional regulator
MNVPRSYEMKRRAASAAQTRDRILDAYRSLFWADPNAQIALADVAEQAGTTVQTVLRHFGTKRGLFEAAMACELERVHKRVDPAAVGDLPATVHGLVDHLEQGGRAAIRTLTTATLSEQLQPVLAEALQAHQQWCEAMFAPWIATVEGRQRRLLTAELMTITAASTWGTLRGQCELSREETEEALLGLLEALLV